MFACLASRIIFSKLAISANRVAFVFAVARVRFVFRMSMSKQLLLSSSHSVRGGFLSFVA